MVGNGPVQLGIPKKAALETTLGVGDWVVVVGAALRAA
jgi:hypothetical protein